MNQELSEIIRELEDQAAIRIAENFIAGVVDDQAPKRFKVAAQLLRLMAMDQRRWKV